MGRGKHLVHKEKKIQVNVKLTVGRLKTLEQSKIIEYFGSINNYVNNLIKLDFEWRHINERLD